MEKLEDINGISVQHVELLEAAGYLEPSALKNSTVNELFEEISKANDILHILNETPSLREVAGWWNQVDSEKDVFGPLGELAGGFAAKPIKVVSEEDAPVAIPLTVNYAKEYKIDIEKLPKAGEPLKVTQAKENRPQVLPTKKIKPRKPAYAEDEDSEVVVTADFRRERVLSLDEFREKGARIAPLERSEALDLTKMTRAETNEGVRSDSRRYIRGVLHKEAAGVYFSAFALLLALVLAVLGVILTPLIFWDKHVFFWAVFAPGLIVVGLAVWFLFARRANCPVCRQRQFMPKACLKHAKAHRIPGFGFMLSTAIHILCFRWFRCIFCGTSIRLKE